MPESNTDDDAVRIVRRFSHDLRNGLNAMEMDVCHLDLLVQNEEARESLLRIRKQMALMEKMIRSLSIRFITPELTPVPVIDIFTKWNSRAMSAFPGSMMKWSCEAKSELVQVDMAIVADALGEMLYFYKSSPESATVDSSKNEVSFRVEWPFPEKNHTSQQSPALPDFEQVIRRNGGKFTEKFCEESGNARCECVFPLAAVI